MSDAENTGCLACIKIPVMIIMFLEIMIFGSLPIRLKAFKENKLLLSLAAGFSGGLFLAIGVIHLLPEANEQINTYFEEQDEADHDHNPPNNPIVGHGGDEDEPFPWAFLVCVLSFSLILFIEKMITAEQHKHGDHDDDAVSLQSRVKKSILQQSVQGYSTLRNSVNEQNDLLIGGAAHTKRDDVDIE